MNEDKKTQLRVGAFVIGALALAAITAFTVGRQRNLFTPKTEFSAQFEDVQGLRPGSVVLVAGVNVGSVHSVEFDEHGRIEVRFRIIDRAAQLIRGRASDSDPSGVVRGSSIVRIGSKGMLGDKLIEIDVGDESLPAWDPSVPLPVSAAGGLMASVNSAMEEVQGTAENLRMATDPFRDQEFSNDIKAAADSIARITEMLATGDGAIQHLMTDPSSSEELQETLENLRATSSEFARTARAIRRITEEVESGDGTAHSLIYGQEGRVALVNIGRASDELALMMEAIRTGDGTVHDLIYENAGEEMIANLTRATEDIAAITSDVRAGRGTIGGLLQDPSIYEDIKRLVGDLERNEILRALVRYSVRRDDAAEPTDVTPAEGSDSASEGSGE